MSQVVVVGGGAAGMMAAATAAECGHEVTLLEKNEKLGKKVYITGKGRCNLTNDCSVEELLQAVCVNRKFLYSAFHSFDSQDTIRFFEESGLRTVTERGNRVFPASNHASDVISALERRMRRAGVRILLHRGVEELLLERAECRKGEMETLVQGIQGKTQNRSSRDLLLCGQGEEIYVSGVRLRDGSFLHADAVIVATGGLSYQTTGSTGDGYRFAKAAGHSVADCSPSLVPMETGGDWARRLQGLSLRNVEVSIYEGKKELFREFGEMLFTHYGVSGPLILTASTAVQKRLKEHPLALLIDLKPALTPEQLDARILREFASAQNKQFKNALTSLYPAKLIPVMVERSGIAAGKPVHDITKEERKNLSDLTRHFPLTLTGLRGYNEAIITRGGVSVKEISPATMESKKVRGLHFAGEVLDLDAVTGGFNLQIAWATGHAAGQGVS